MAKYFLGGAEICVLGASSDIKVLEDKFHTDIVGDFPTFLPIQDGYFLRLAGTSIMEAISFGPQRFCQSREGTQREGHGTRIEKQDIMPRDDESQENRDFYVITV